MILLFVATGILEPATGGVAVVTPSERYIKLVRSRMLSAAQQAMDPFDTIDFVLDMSDLLESMEKFDTLLVQVPPESQIVGFIVMESGGYETIELSDSQVRIWAGIEPEFRDLAQWKKGGQCRVDVTATTNSNPPRVWKRTAQISVID